MRTVLGELCVLEEVWRGPWGNLGGTWRGMENLGGALSLVENFLN